MMENEVDGSEETKGLVHIAGCRFGVSEGCDLCVLGCVAFVFYFLLPHFSCLFQFPHGSKKK